MSTIDFMSTVATEVDEGLGAKTFLVRIYGTGYSNTCDQAPVHFAWLMNVGTSGAASPAFATAGVFFRDGISNIKYIYKTACTNCLNKKCRWLPDN